MEQLENSDGNRSESNNSINIFATIYESDNEEGTKLRTKFQTTIIVISKEENRRKNKRGQNMSNEENKNDQ